jgi:hypothetical protein
MNKAARGKALRALPGKKTRPAFSRKSVENSLETAARGTGSDVPQEFSRKKPQNALELARALCVLANGGLAQHRSEPPDEDRKQQWREAVDELLAAPNARPERTFSDESLDRMAGISLPQRIEEECGRLAQELSVTMRNSEFGQPFLFERRELVKGRVDPTTGRGQHRSFAILGRYQNVLADVLDHPQIDFRRFARCTNQKCLAFFYRPRLSSQTCSDRCAGVLTSRAHYQRAKELAKRARELHDKGKRKFEIACLLKVKLSRVRKYLDSKLVNEE